MARTKHSLIPAWILRALPYRDTSLLIEAMTRKQGRVGLVARGARGGRSHKRESLQAFRPVLLSWTETGDLGSLTAVEPAGAAVPLKGEQVFSGWYLNELLLRLTQRHDPHPGLFDSYSRTLDRLDSQGEAALRYFEIDLLAESGFGLDWPAQLEESEGYRVAPDASILRESTPSAQSCSGRTLAALQGRRLEGDAQLREARQLLRRLLAHHLGDKPLATATTFRQLRDVQAR